MFFEGRTFPAAAQALCAHLNRLLNTTLTRSRMGYVIHPASPGIADLHLREGRMPGARLRSPRFGPLFLHLGQYVASEPAAGGRHRLRAVRYRYALSSALDTEALVRWESSPGAGHGHDLWCRYHVQGTARIDFPRHTAILNDLHLPTGLVTIEDIVRFCIVDLGVKPLSGDWDQILHQGLSTGGGG